MFKYVLLFLWRIYTYINVVKVQLQVTDYMVIGVSIGLLFVLFTMYQKERMSNPMPTAFVKTTVCYGVLASLSILSLMVLHHKMPEDLYVPTHVMPIMTKINNYLRYHTVIFSYLQNMMLVSSSIACCSFCTCYMITENRYKTGFISGYIVLFLLGQSAFFTIIRPLEKMLSVNHYILFMVSIIGCLGVMYMFIRDKINLNER